MPDIRAFQGLRYNPQQFGGSFDDVIAPPYDVLDEQDKAALLARSDRNIVAVDLPFVPPKSAGPDQVYTDAAAKLKQWRDDGTLIRDEQPAIYVYHQEYTYAGKSYIRKKFFARMRIEAFGTGTVFPHEQTFGGPKEDRRKLMEATNAQLSPIFGLYSDPENAVSAVLDVSNTEPTMTATMEGIVNRMWAVTDSKVIAAVQKQMHDRPVYIADGHHRYGTALTYRDAQGELPADHPARFVFIGLCGMEDPGCLILPTHRVISGFGDKKPSDVFAALQNGMQTKTANPNVTNVNQLLPADSPDDLGIYMAAGDRMYTGKFTKREILETLAADHSPAWRSLDLAYLHRYLLDECVTKELLGGTPPTTAYIKLADKAIETARETNGIALICKPCSMEELRGVSHAGDLMPQKSTFFYPKLATGLVVNPLE